MPLPSRRFRAVALAVCLTACIDDPLTAPSAPSAPATLPQAGSGAADTADLRAVPRFRVELTADAAPRLGAPIRLTLSARADLATRDAELRITLPELEAARAANWAPHRVPAGRVLDAAGAWRGSIPAGGVRRVEATVVIPAPGYYRVVASAIKRSDEPPVIDGRFVQDVAHQELWIYLDADGGRVTGQFDATVFPDDMRPQPGLLVPKRRGGGRPGSARPIRPDAAGAADPVPGRINGRVYYYNRDAFRWEPLVRAYVMARAFDAYSGNETGGTSSTTDETGYYEIGCPDYLQDFHGEVWLQNSAVRVEPLVATTFFYTWPDCELEVDMMTNFDDGSRVFTNMTRTADLSGALLQRGRGRITVLLRSSVDNSYYRAPNFWSDEHIVIKTNASVSHIWGEFGLFTTAHEYGHAVHEGALGGNAASGECGDSHDFDSRENLQCAYSEGFADWHAIATLAASTFYASNMEANRYHPGGDGSIIEGPVAAFFTDLVDPPNEAHDVVQYPASYLADIIRTCVVNTINVRANGVDHLVYCFERQVDPAITGSATYFPTRSTDPTSQSESATEPPDWNRDNIRRLWLKNLYLQDFFAPAPAFSVSISGPTRISTRGTYTWTANVSGGSGGYTYQWQFSDDEVNWVDVGTSQSYSRFDAGEYDFYLRVFVTSGGQTASDTHFVQGNACADGGRTC